MDIVVETNIKKLKKIGLALGGGGARGFAHVGALKAFEENNIKFDFIAGTSVGALVGAFICAGKTSGEILDIANGLSKNDLRTNKIPFMPSKTTGIEELIIEELGDINIEDLPMPLCIIAVDVKTGQEIHISKGNLAKAVAGSCAVPGIYSPVEFEDYLLFDGGLQNNVPSDVPKLNNCEACVAIDVNSTRGQGTNSEKYFDLLKASIDIMMKSNVIKGYLNADIMIPIDLKAYHSSSLDGSEEMVKIGYETTNLYIKKIKDLFRKRDDKTGFFSFFKSKFFKFKKEKAMEIK